MRVGRGAAAEMRHPAPSLMIGIVGGPGRTNRLVVHRLRSNSIACILAASDPCIVIARPSRFLFEMLSRQA